MKKVKFFGLAGIILLASGAGFSSCSSDSADSTGGTGVAGQVVKTQFYLNIPYAGNEKGGNARVSTRMSDVNTQHTNEMAANFLGLANMEMFAFEGTPGVTYNTSTRSIQIGNGDETTTKDNWRRLYSDIAIPVGTKNFILYARASKKNKTNSDKSNFEAGFLSNPYENFTDEAKPKLDELNFELLEIHNSTDFNAKGKSILDQLNTIARSSVTDGTSPKWATIDQSSDYTPDEREQLQILYNKFTKLTAGSATSVKLLIEDLKAAIISQGLTNSMATAIKGNCESALTALTDCDFPRNLNLPDGVAKVRYDNSTYTFTYEEITPSTGSSTNQLIDYRTVTYPSELAYFVSSPVRTSPDEKTAINDLPDYNNWLNGTGTWTDFSDIVLNNTSFVALKNPVQYGVACLESNVKCSSTTLKDNASDTKFGYKADNTITIPEDGFKITGVLIGGQPKGVAWDFEPASSASFKYTIYDKNMNIGFVANASKTKSNYTLVLDNKVANETKQNNVYVTIELENDAADFYGAEGLIPKGSKFYLVGLLDLTKNKTNPSGKLIDHVFVKDHTTVANFTITNLKKAYNHIPDMRTSKINVGLAVDLSWQEGITFNVDL